MASPGNNTKSLILHFVVVTSIGDTVVYEASHPSPLNPEFQLDLEFFVHASLDTLDLLCREKPDCFFPQFETGDGNNRQVSAYCPIGPYRLLLVAQPGSVMKLPEVKNFFVQCSRTLSDDHLRNPMATIHAKIQSQGVKDALRQHLDRLQRTSM